MFEELAKVIGAYVEIDADDQPDSELAVLDRIERAYRQVDAAERDDIKLRSLDDFLRAIN